MNYCIERCQRYVESKKHILCHDNIVTITLSVYLCAFRVKIYPNMGKLPLKKSELHDAVYTTTDISIGYFNMLSKGTLSDIVPVSKQQIITAFLTLIMRKNSCLTPSFDSLIDKVVTHGFIRKWINEIRMPLSMQKKKKLPQILTLNQVQGIFYICGVLYVVATVVFIWEYASYRINARISSELTISKLKILFIMLYMCLKQ